VQAHEVEPWQEDGETWRRLHVTFPDTIATHNPEQVFYFDADGMQRRMDYAPEVNGSPPTAHYTGDSKTFGGIVVPTRRRVHRRNVAHHPRRPYPTIWPPACSSAPGHQYRRL